MNGLSPTHSTKGTSVRVLGVSGGQERSRLDFVLVPVPECPTGTDGGRVPESDSL